MCYWLKESGFAVFYGLMIYVFALQSGLISRILSFKPLVYAGEISFTIYMLHQLIHFAIAGRLLARMSHVLSYAAYWVILITASIVVYEMYESPVRRIMLTKCKSMPLIRNVVVVSTMVALFITLAFSLGGSAS